MMTRSTSAPNSGANPNTTIAKANALGMPQPPCPDSVLSCQNTNPDSVPNAPCAKLKIPDVV